MTINPMAIFRFMLRWSLSIWGLVSVAAAAAHRLQLDEADLQSYARSPLTGIVTILVLALLIHLLAMPLYAIYLVVRRRWRDLGILAINVAVGIICLLVSVQVDAPTLVYRT